ASSSPRTSFLFFQAEDGIRDRNVTGVQTCALPISTSVDSNEDVSIPYPGFRIPSPNTGKCAPVFYNFKSCSTPDISFCSMQNIRSEERRVGKECRSQRAPDQ